jgi:hypothetical protein
MKNISKIVVLILVILLFTSITFAQVGIGTNTPETTAQLDVRSTSKGFLPPRMTSQQRDAISSPAQGLIIYCTNCGTNGEVEVYNGITWANISGAAVAATLPILTTTTATDITSNDAISGGNITYDGGAQITSKGVCWSLTVNPTISNSKTSDGTGTGVFSSSLTGLTADTTYYIRAYATNSSGTSYGNQVTLRTAKQFFAYVFLESNDVTIRGALNSYMLAQGSAFRGFLISTPSSVQSTFNTQMNAYLSYTGWGNSEPAIFTAPIPTKSGGLDQYGVYIDAYKFQTIKVPGYTLPIGVLGQFIIIIPIAALNGNRHSTILSGNSANGFLTVQSSPLVINGNELTIYYTGSVNIPAGDYKVHYVNTAFRYAPGANDVYFKGGALVPN